VDFIHKVVDGAFYTVSYQGKLLMWYLFDLEELTRLQHEITKMGSCEDEQRKYCESTGHKTWCDRHKRIFIDTCTKLKTLIKYEDEHGGKPRPYPRGPHFRMISIEPSELIAVEKPSAGPLVPFFVDAENCLLFEGILPGQESKYQYFSQVNLGQKVVCKNPKYRQ